MDGEIRDAVTEWGTRAVADGVAGLYELADGNFSGAVTDGTVWAFVLNGRFVGVFDGDIGSFEGAPLTAHVAPDLSLPLLFAMQERGGEVRGEYYSNETPLREIDGTLSSGNFVGYVELSENVLSGDYYVVYYGGRALPVAYVGNSRQLLTGDEAFERAADEVGIYSVVEAAVEVVDLPDRPEPDPEPPSPAAHPDVAMTPSEADGTAEGAENGGEDEGADPDGLGEASDPATANDERITAEAADDDPPQSPGFDAEAVDAGRETADENPDPSSMARAEGESADGAPAATAEGEPTPTAGDGSTSDDATTATEERSSEAAGAGDTPAGPDTATTAAVGSMSDAGEAERLRERIAELEAEIERLEADTGAGEAAPERTLSPGEALAGTHLFVRYDDRADGTLADATAGGIGPDGLSANLTLDYHTEFETAGTRVDGEPFEAFLRGTPEHRFVEWLLTGLLFEIRRSEAARLSKLYDAVAQTDRIDFDAGIDGPAGTDTASFDVVFRNKMGDPLFLATFETSREPTRAESIRSLVDGARSVSEATPSLAAAFVVTTSFFGADAMKAAVDATRGGLFNRSSRSSYVKLSRKTGFHLCLVEARDGEFYLAEPEL